MANKIKPSRPHIPEYGIPETTEGMLPWSYVTGRLEQALNYWVGTTDEQGRPHVTPVWGVWVDDVLYFDGSPKTRRGRNLAHNPAVAVHLENGTEVVILEGEALELRGSDLALREKLARAYSVKYTGMGYEPTPDTWREGGLYRVTIQRAFAWTKFPDDATRWRFE